MWCKTRRIITFDHCRTTVKTALFVHARDRVEKNAARSSRTAVRLFFHLPRAARFAVFTYGSPPRVR